MQREKYIISKEAKEAIFRGLLKCQAFILENKDYRTAGGLRIPYYVNWKRLASDPEILRVIAKEFSKIIEIEKCDYIGGMETGGIAFATAVSLETGKPFFYIRKEKQNHGAGEYLVGMPPKKEANIILIDDSAGSGGSLKKFRDNLREEGYDANVFAYVMDADIMRKHEERINQWRAEGVNPYYLVTYDEWIEWMIKNKLISSDFARFNYIILDNPLEFRKNEIIEEFTRLKKENKIWVKQGHELS